MRKEFFCALGFICVMAFETLSAQVVIRGNAASYAGTELKILSFTEQITRHDTCISKTRVDTSGDFSFTLPVKEIAYIFVPLGIYEGFLYIVPGMEYVIELPEKEEKTIEDKFNPYFKEEKIHLNLIEWGDIGGQPDTTVNELNHQINNFDYLADKFIVKMAKRLYSETNTGRIDSTIGRISELFDDYDNVYFRNYKTYRVAAMKQLIHRDKQKISQEYFYGKPVLYNNPAYMDLFNLLFGDFLVEKTYLKNIDALSKFIYTADVKGLKKQLKEKKVFINDTLCEMALLKGIYDGLYADIYNKNVLLGFLDSLHSATSVPVHKTIAFHIREKFNKLRKGHKPPDFELYDRDSNLVSRDSLAGDYVYLNFASPESYACLKDFDVLRMYHERFGDKLKIVTVFIDEDRKAMDEFLAEHDYSWCFLYSKPGGRLVKNYDISVFPMYYFLDKKNRLIFSPAPTPEDGFETILYKYFRDKGEL
jgi:peroxiredoxin